MQRRLDQWTTALTVMLVVAALLACKKQAPTPGAPSAEPLAATPSAAALPTSPVAPTAVETAAPANDGAKLGEVKRYPDKEKAQTGTARIVSDGVKVFDEADDKTADVATLDKDLLVFRLASIPDWELVEFPAGVGKVAPGWIAAKAIDLKSDSSVARDAVATQAKTAVVKPTSSAAPKASGSAAPKASASSSAAPKASASAAPAASASAKASSAPTLVAPLGSAPSPAEIRAAARAARSAARAAAAAASAAGK